MAAHKTDKIAGAVIRRLRDRSGITRETLAAALGLSQQQVGKYESGENRISISRLFDLAEALGTEPGVIIQLIEQDLKAKEFSKCRQRRKS